MDFRLALEAVALAHERVDHVDLDERPGPDVRGRLRRADVSEEQVIVIPHAGRPLGREVRRSVGADGRVERELLLADQPLHVVGEDAHQLPASVSISAHAIGPGSVAAGLPPRRWPTAGSARSYRAPMVKPVCGR